MLSDELRGVQVSGRGQRKSSGSTPFSSTFTTRTEGRVLVADKVPDCFLTPIHHGCATSTNSTSTVYCSNVYGLR